MGPSGFASQGVILRMGMYPAVGGVHVLVVGAY